MTRLIGMLLIVAAASSLPGCSYLCRFEARGIIGDAASGQPIGGAKAELVDEAGHVLAGPMTANEDGAFELSFETSPSTPQERTGWKLVLTADGYEEKRIAVGTVKEPKNGNERVYLIFHVAIRRKAQ